MQPEAGESQYAALMLALARFRSAVLSNRPSDRSLADIVGKSPTTIGDWLRADRFPQAEEPLLALVEAVRRHAERVGADRAVVGDLLDPGLWRRVYRAEVRRRAAATSTAVMAQQARGVVERMRPGTALDDVTDPFVLEVHRAIADPGADAPDLPLYVPRQHDADLAAVVSAAATGASRMAVLVGGSSTGKTRACWEALRRLRGQDRRWRLWHPIAPTRSAALLAELDDVSPYTVVWLNEAQLYLAHDKDGEQVAARLRALLRDPRRAPVLVLATLWPDHWATLTTRRLPDRHPDARELLVGHRIKVPDAFSEPELAALTTASGRDRRLGEAAMRARDGMVTQYLAGAPVLMDRYQDAPPGARALVHAAMDALRLGAGPRLRLAWLAEAAPGYLTEGEWDQLGEAWLQDALDYLTTPCNGTPGVLATARIPFRTTRGRCAPATEAANAQHQHRYHAAPLYRLADYLEQHGRLDRAEVVPPIAFWDSALAYAHPHDLDRLAASADRRKLLRDAARLRKRAADLGDTQAAASLVTAMTRLAPEDRRPAHWAAAHAAVDNPEAVLALLKAVMEAGIPGPAATLSTRAAARTPLHDPRGVAELLESVRGRHTADQRATLLARDPAAHVDLHNPYAVAEILRTLREVGAEAQVTALASRAAALAALDDPDGVARLLTTLQAVGAADQVPRLLARHPAAHARVDSPSGAASLLSTLNRLGAADQVRRLATRAAADALLDEPRDVAVLLTALRNTGLPDVADLFIARDLATRAELRDLEGVAELLRALEVAQEAGQVNALATRAAADAPVSRAYSVAELLRALRDVRAEAQVTALASRVVADTVLGRDASLPMLLRTLCELGAEDQAAALATRIADSYPVSYAGDVAELLHALWKARANEQIAAFVARIASHARDTEPAYVAALVERICADPYSLVEFDGPEDPDHAPAVADLLKALRSAGAADLVAAALKSQPRRPSYNSRSTAQSADFGREPDGSATAPWGWDDLASPDADRP